MINDGLRLRFIDFSSLKQPRLGYADQTTISHERVDMITACAIHHGLHIGMVIRFIKEEYVGESRDADTILSLVSDLISDKV
jgi:hypothetical protein